MLAVPASNEVTCEGRCCLRVGAASSFFFVFVVVVVVVSQLVPTQCRLGPIRAE